MTAVANPDLNLSNAAAWDRGGLDFNGLQSLYSSGSYNFNLFSELAQDNGSTSSALSAFNSKMKPADVHLMLARAIQRRKSTLFAQPGRTGNNVTQLMKEEEWESLRKEMVANGVNRFERKTWQTVRDVDFQQIRRKALHRQTLAQQGHGTMPETEFDVIMMDILSFNNNDGRFDFSKLETNGSSPLGNESDRYTESPQAFDPSSQAMANLLSSLINSQTSSVDVLSQLGMTSHTEECATTTKHIIDKPPSISAAQTDSSSANSVHANENVQTTSPSTIPSLDGIRFEILKSQLRTQQNCEKAAELQLKKSEYEAELAKLQLEKFKEQQAEMYNLVCPPLMKSNDDEDDEPSMKRPRIEAEL